MSLTNLDIKYEIERRRYNKINSLFPNEGSNSRDLYIKHMEVIKATATFRQVCMMAGNRIGKSELGAYITACHLTGLYPDWWSGKKFDKPTSVIAAGETGTLVRDSLQEKLLGAINDIGSGIIPKKDIVGHRPRAGIPNAIDTALIAHKNGGQSILQFQSYDQGREKFQATARHLIWCDEEPPLEVYIEMLLRTMTTDGLVLSTFTPLKGISSTVMYLQTQARDGKAKVITATWDDAPHLTEKQKQDLFDALPPHQRDARSKGVPSLGAGAVYPINESEFVIAPTELPKHWKFAYGLDVGWNNTAAVWGAIDPDSDVLYIYSDYKHGQAEPPIHAAAIKSRGDWIPGTIDPASRGRTQNDGSQLIQLYRQQGLNLVEADNGVESGIFEIYERLCTGRLKVFSTCVTLLEEFRLYRRDEKGRIVKDNDHCFTGDTKIMTTEGVRRIDTLSNGALISLNNKKRKFVNCRLTKKLADVIKITFSDGYTVKCTPEHLFLTTKGFIKAIDLMDTSSYIVTLNKQGESVWKLSSIQKQSKNLMGNVIIYAALIFIEVAIKAKNVCTGLFGSKRIIPQFQKASTSIILTRINLITSLATLSLRRRASIYPSIRKENTKLCLVRRYWRQLIGINPKRGRCGTKDIMRKLKTSCTRLIKGSVATATHGTTQEGGSSKPFVQTIVNQHIESQVALIMSLESVSFVRKISLLTNILKQKPVQDYALVRVVSIESAGKQDVYCLDVPDGNLFCLENGMVVHNCLDSLRYLGKTGLKIAKQKIDNKPSMRVTAGAGSFMGA